MAAIASSLSSMSRCFFVGGNSFGNPKSQILQNTQITPNMANPSHQFPTHRVSCIVNQVWTPSSTYIERKLESSTNPTAAPEMKRKYTFTENKTNCYKRARVGYEMIISYPTQGRRIILKYNNYIFIILYNNSPISIY